MASTAKEDKSVSNNDYSLILSYFVVLIIGFSFIPFLSIQIDNIQKSPELNISFSWPNTSPEIIEKEATTPLESILSTLSNLKKISSISSSETGNIKVEFDEKVNIDEKRFEVSSAIRQAYGKLPKQLTYPSISSYSNNEGDLPMQTYLINGNRNLSQLKKFANEKIKPRLSLIENIGKIEIFGDNPMLWKIALNPNLLAIYKIDYNDVQNALQAFFFQQSIGISSIELEDSKSLAEMQISIKSDALSQFIWQKIPITRAGNRIIFLSDIGKVTYEEPFQNNIYRINGLNAVSILIFPAKAENNFQIVKNVNNEINKLQTDLPNDIRLYRQYDATEYVKEELISILMKLAISFLLFLILIYTIYRSFKFLLVLFLSSLATFSIAIIITVFLHINLQITAVAGIILGFILSIGYTVIIITSPEKKSLSIILHGVSGAIIASITIFAVVFFMPQDLKIKLESFATFFIIILFSSLIVSVTFVPSLLKKISLNVRQRIRSRFKISVLYSNLLEYILFFRKSLILILILSFGIPFFNIPTALRQETWYKKIFDNTFGSETYKSFKPYIDVFTGGTLRLFSQKVSTSEFQKNHERTKLYIDIQLSNGNTIDNMNSYFKVFEKTLFQFKELEQFTSVSYSPTSGLITVLFKKEFENGSFPYQLRSALINKMIYVGGAKCSILGVGDGFSNFSDGGNNDDFQILLKGYNYEELKNQTEILKNILKKSDRVANINENKSIGLFENSLFEYNLLINNYKISQSNISMENLFHSIQKQSVALIPNLIVSSNANKEQISIVSNAAQRNNIWDFYNAPLLIKGDSNIVKLKDFAEIKLLNVSQEIRKENQEYLRLVSFNYLGAKKFGFKYLDASISEINALMPVGYRAERRISPEWEKDNSHKFIYIVLGMFFLYIISVIIFESFYKPLAIIFSIPVSFIGIFLTYYNFDIVFDDGGFISFFIVGSIVSGITIIIINEHLSIQKSNLLIDKKEAFLMVMKDKWSNIIVICTGISLLLLPYIVFFPKEYFWYNIATGSIGGLVFSVFAIPLFLPIFLNLEAGKLLKLSRRK